LIKSKTDPCLLYSLDEKGELEGIMVIHVDNCLICGSETMVKPTKEAIKKFLIIKDKGKLKKFLGFSYEWWDDSTLRRLHEGYH
jgi:hypothetical protein